MKVIKVRIYFFFSSRRRHTRLTCDWSSDVCSSDLLDLHQEAFAADPRMERKARFRFPQLLGPQEGVGERHAAEVDEGPRQRRAAEAARSEERRVGKECRRRWRSYDETNTIVGMSMH